MSNQEIVNFILKKIKNGVNRNKIAKLLISYAINKKYSMDNVSVIIIYI